MDPAGQNGLSGLLLPGLRDKDRESHIHGGSGLVLVYGSQSIAEDPVA